MKPYIIKDDNEDYTTYDYALYAGENLSPQYPDSHHFYIYTEDDGIWERHAFFEKIWNDVQKPDSHDRKRFVRYVFTATKWEISS